MPRPGSIAAPRGLAAVAEHVESLLALLVETAAALLVLVEILVLFSGVVARYVFGHPLVWSDELASILFLWLSMLGAVIALRRGEHMRMTALVGRLGPPGRALFDMIAITASLALLVLIDRKSVV